MSKDKKREQQPIVETVPAQCPQCQSTCRDKFAATVVRVIDGHRFTWRRTKCRQCGQLYQTREKVRLAKD